MLQFFTVPYYLSRLTEEIYEEPQSKYTDPGTVLKREPPVCKAHVLTPHMPFFYNESRRAVFKFT